ncbi:hypothetical protein BJ508DRAFT_336932, partial [Ascobolus immersus RN42]
MPKSKKKQDTKEISADESSSDDESGSEKSDKRQEMDDDDEAVVARRKKRLEKVRKQRDAALKKRREAEEEAARAAANAKKRKQDGKKRPFRTPEPSDGFESEAMRTESDLSGSGGEEGRRKTKQLLRVKTRKELMAALQELQYILETEIEGGPYLLNKPFMTGYKRTDRNGIISETIGWLKKARGNKNVKYEDAKQFIMQRCNDNRRNKFRRRYRQLCAEHRRKGLPPPPAPKRGRPRKNPVSKPQIQSTKGRANGKSPVRRSNGKSPVRRSNTRRRHSKEVGSTRGQSEGQNSEGADAYSSGRASPFSIRQSPITSRPSTPASHKSAHTDPITVATRSHAGGIDQPNSLLVRFPDDNYKTAVECPSTVTSSIISWHQWIRRMCITWKLGIVDGDILCYVPTEDYTPGCEVSPVMRLYDLVKVRECKSINIAVLHRYDFEGLYGFLDPTANGNRRILSTIPARQDTPHANPTSIVRSPKSDRHGGIVDLSAHGQSEYYDTPDTISPTVRARSSGQAAPQTDPSREISNLPNPSILEALTPALPGYTLSRFSPLTPAKRIYTSTTTGVDNLEMRKRQKTMAAVAQGPPKIDPNRHVIEEIVNKSRGYDAVLQPTSTPQAVPADTRLSTVNDFIRQRIETVAVKQDSKIASMFQRKHEQ